MKRLALIAAAIAIATPGHGAEFATAQSITGQFEMGIRMRPHISIHIQARTKWPAPMRRQSSTDPLANSKWLFLSIAQFQPI